MLLQHIVQVAIQREFVLTDNLHYPGYTLVKLLADIHRFAASGIGGGVPDKKTLVILAFPSSAASLLFRSRRGGGLAGRKEASKPSSCSFPLMRSYFNSSINSSTSLSRLLPRIKERSAGKSVERKTERRLAFCSRRKRLVSGRKVFRTGRPSSFITAS